MRFRVNAKPHGYGQLTERQQDEFAAMIGEVFPEAKHHIRHATRRHWRNKMKPYSHIDMLKHSVPVDDERSAATESPLEQ
ncbi:hypothetical protein AAVH_08102 [Aphelenchoides avenae]|nr:hypothetical protein AAVH_08102 [Aphelenchus avenae]